MTLPDPAAGLPDPIRPCSIAELDEFRRILRRLGNRGLATVTQTVWTRPDRRPVIALTSLIGIGCVLLMRSAPAASGILLVILFSAWILEAAGFGTPLSWASPSHATQDAFHRSRARDRRRRVLLLIRTSSPRSRGSLAQRMETAAWPLIGAAIVVLAVLAGVKGVVDAHNPSAGFDGAVTALSLFPSALFLTALGTAILGTSDRKPWDAISQSGLPQALEALEILEDGGGPAPDLMIVGAATEGRDRRVLRSHRECAAACRCWEYRSGDGIVAAIRAETG